MGNNPCAQYPHILTPYTHPTHLHQALPSHPSPSSPLSLTLIHIHSLITPLKPSTLQNPPMLSTLTLIPLNHPHPHPPAPLPLNSYTLTPLIPLVSSSPSNTPYPRLSVITITITSSPLIPTLTELYLPSHSLSLTHASCITSNLKLPSNKYHPCSVPSPSPSHRLTIKSPSVTLMCTLTHSPLISVTLTLTWLRR